ncbi:FeoA family protein [Alienimonas californiensis]|uniref:Ferrous iron transport protein A n=1 Tax=Alienimonas californiensis TaxID=2527989 RepID=A0A517P3W6_9PLAN|nr:ferrous iron transport protein A [Alienimonas californiensis]QDT14062.1 ferrous iron transport protein A [Alienimonas californiensis]
MNDQLAPGKRPDDGSPPTELTLAALPAGRPARILDVLGEDALAARLMEMGLIPGETVVFHRAAPLGDPLEFSVCGYRISLRKSEAARVTVAPD